MKPVFRQGDILIIATKPPTHTRLVNRDNRGIVLAEGETTGHAHTITDTTADLYQLINTNDIQEMNRRFLHVQQEVALTHQEHATIMLPPGNYEIIRQIEYAPETLRTVAD